MLAIHTNISSEGRRLTLIKTKTIGKYYIIEIHNTYPNKKKRGKFYFLD